MTPDMLCFFKNLYVNFLLTVAEYLKGGKTYLKAFWKRGVIDLKQTLTLYRLVEEGGWSSNYRKFRDSNWFVILRVSIFRIDLVIRPKRRRNPFLGAKSHETLVVESWRARQNYRKTWFTTSVLRYLYPSDKRKCFKNTIFLLFETL